MKFLLIHTQAIFRLMGRFLKPWRQNFGRLRQGSPSFFGHRSFLFGFHLLAAQASCERHVLFLMRQRCLINSRLECEEYDGVRLEEYDGDDEASWALLEPDAPDDGETGGA